MSARLVPRFTLAPLAFALSACTPRPATAPVPVDLPEQPEQPVVMVVADAADVPAVDEAAAAAPVEVVLKGEWSKTEVYRSPYAHSRDAAELAAMETVKLLDTSAAGLGVTAAWYAAVNEKAERASLFYAIAYRAHDATPAQRIDAALEGGRHALGVAKRFEAVGLATLPKAWRAETTLAITFEDVAQGPARRWRDEGRALIQLCIESGAELDVQNASTTLCLDIRKAEGTVAVRRAFARDAGARGCKCSPGDPLCSESAAWCTRD